MIVPVDSKGARRRGVLLFSIGAAGAVVLGCALAAVDLWGGVRALPVRPRTFAVSAVACAVAIVAGAYLWLRSFPSEQRLLRGAQATGALALLAAVIGGGLFAYGAQRLRRSDEICLRAECATSRREREDLLREGKGPLFPVIDPGFECLRLEKERRDLEARAACPAIPMNDAPCQCGDEGWTGASRCDSGPTTCELRPQTKRWGLGCAGLQTVTRVRACATP